jgi:hypothetical protein
MTSINEISFSPSQLPDIPLSPSSIPKAETHSAPYEGSSRVEPYYRFGGLFSSADVDFLVNLVLSGEWKDVEFYIQFLISHYEKFLNNHNTLTENIVEKLYELLVKVKSQKFYEALEFNDNDTAISVLTKEITTISQRLPSFPFKHLQNLFNDRNAFREHKLNMARESGMHGGSDDSCIKYRNTVATEIREQLNELLNMYGSLNSADTRRGRLSSKSYEPNVVDEARGWKRKTPSTIIASEPELEGTPKTPISFSPHPSNLDYTEEEPMLKKRKMKKTMSPVSTENPIAKPQSAKLGNMDVLLEAFDMMAQEKGQAPPPSKAFQPFNEINLSTKPAKPVRNKQPKLDATVEQKITESLDFQSIKPTKTIKPVRKLCTGGITSTPAIRERMIKVLEQYKTPVTWETIQHKVSGNRAKVWATLCMFVNEGIVLQTGKGRRGHPYKYIMKTGVTSDSVQGEMETKFKKLDHEAMKLHKQYREKQQEEMQHIRQKELQHKQQSPPKPVFQIQENPVPIGFAPQQHPDVAKLISPRSQPYGLPSVPTPFRPFHTFDTSGSQMYRNVSRPVVSFSGTTRPTAVSSPAH